MAMNIGSSGKGKRRRAINDINVTPLVDVMLVLLVIFMITAPTLKEGFFVEIPQADATQQINIEEAFQITVTEAGNVLRPGAQTDDLKYERLSELMGDLQKYREEQESAQKSVTVVIVGDKKAPYERVMHVWNAVRNAGISQVSLQVDPGAPADALAGPR